MSEMTRQSVLLVEDDAVLAAMVSEFLLRNGLHVNVVGRGDAAVDRIRMENPDAVVLDINLPGLDGISVCRTVRDDYDGVILMLTARGDESDEVICLEAGADDYMAKPVRPRALLTRLQMHLRRGVPSVPDEPPRTIEVGSLLIEQSRRMVHMDGEELRLTTAEFDLLYVLAERVGQPISRQELYERLHGMSYDGLDRSIDLRISRLRKKLGDDPATPERIKSVRGIGYQLAVEL